MAIYLKRIGTNGKWVKGSEVINGTRCKLVSETTPMPSQFKDKNGNTKTQDVAKIRFENNAEVMNISLNNATISALVDAFGEDSAKWQNHYLTAQTEKVLVSGKRVVAVYLVPEGYELSEDRSGYVVIVKQGSGEIETEEAIGEDAEPSEDSF